MKALIFMTQIHSPSGAELSSMELAVGLNRRAGIHADLLSIYSQDLPGVGEATQPLLRAGIPAIRFLGLKPGGIQTQFVKAVLRLRRLIRDGHYDIVETSQYGPTILAAWAMIGLNCRHVGSVRQTFLRTRETGIRGWFFRFSMAICPRARYYAISRDTARHWERYTGFPEGCTQVIYNSVAEEFFFATPSRREVRQELSIPPDGRILLFVGRVLKGKGVDTILEALGPILESENLYLLYVGEEASPSGHFLDEAGLPDRLRARIAIEGWEARVKFLGRRNDVATLMASSDLLVHPSRSEAFGRILAEAMAAGVPIVASNVGGIPEVLEGTDSLMVPPDAPDLLRKAVLESLHRSDAKVAVAVARGREKANAFRSDKRVDAMIQLFSDSMGSGGRP